MRILIIANSRYKGGLSGGDAIYESFKKYWPASITVWDMQKIDYKPFAVCYLHRIILGCFIALIDPNRWDIVYSASDFLPDSLPAFILKMRRNKWIAGFYLKAFRENKFHYFTQKVVRKLIDKFADMVIVTNPTMLDIFKDKKQTWINGGIDLELAGISTQPIVYEAVFCGRIHPSKGIDELIEFWNKVRKIKPNAQLALIGDGDLGVEYIKHKLFCEYGINKYNGINLLGYMGDQRFDVYKMSRYVLYPTPKKYDHFSMAPIEAMACGCQLVANKLDTFEWFKKNMNLPYITFEEYLDGYKLDNGPIRSFEWARHFDYKKESLRVFNEIKKEMYEDFDNWIEGYGGNSSMQIFKPT